MREKCCKNCLYFREEEISNWYSNGRSKTKYHCDLNDLHNGEVSDPEDQFCGDEKWQSVNIKTRIENLEKLGI
jgi:hypothetical protein